MEHTFWECFAYIIYFTISCILALIGAVTLLNLLLSKMGFFIILIVIVLIIALLFGHGILMRAIVSNMMDK